MTTPVSRAEPGEVKSAEQPGWRLLARHVPRCAEPEVGEGGRGGDPAARRAHQEAPLDEERLVDVLDGLGLLADADGQRGEPHGTTAEALADGRQDRPV